MNMYGIANDISFKSLHVKVDLLQYSTIFISSKKNSTNLSKNSTKKIFYR